MDMGRVVTAMVTPFKDDLTLDLDAAKTLARHLVASGSDSIVIFGTTGEAPALTEDEKIALLEAVVEAVGTGRVIAGTGSNSTQGSIRLSRRAVKSGAGAIMLVCPYYNKPGQEGMYRHFRAIVDEAGVPAILYNIPGRTGVNLLPETVARLAQVPDIVAIKEASGSLDQVSAIRSLTPREFRIYSGDDSLTLPILAVGGHGVVSVASHVTGPRIRRMIDAFVCGDVVAARDQHLSLLPLFKGLFVATNPIPVKKALNVLGFRCGPCRPPLEELSPEQERGLQQVLERVGVDGLKP
ncbi:MAG: 4-hydroxy-tetrahydrodipicolinate synthase [Firmicutes bacterium]|nr:4-hydroxy-tetrahydrodipicolinate synthase [Bacillota bacterium]